MYTRNYILLSSNGILCNNVFIDFDWQRCVPRCLVAEAIQSPHVTERP